MKKLATITLITILVLSAIPAHALPTSAIISVSNGSYILVGDEGVDVRAVYLKIGERYIAEPPAIELFNFNIERIRILLQSCKGDFLFETTCVQAGIVLLVSALEAYFKKRFIELEKEGES